MDLNTYRRSDHLISLKRYEAAIEVLQDMLPNADMKEYIWNQIGYCYIQLNQYEKAFPMLENALIEDPEHYNAFLNIGCCYMQLKKYEAAKEKFDQCLVMDPENVNPLINLIAICFEQKQYEKAEEYLVRAREIDPDNELVMRHGIDILAIRNDLEGLQIELDQGLSKYPTHANYLALQALLSCGKEDFKLAKELALQALAIQPDNTRAIRALGIVDKNRNAFTRIFVANAFRTIPFYENLWRLIILVFLMTIFPICRYIFPSMIAATWIAEVADNSMMRLDYKRSNLLYPLEIKQSNFFLFQLLLIALMAGLTIFYPLPILYKAISFTGLLLVIGISYFELTTKFGKTNFTIITAFLLAGLLIFSGADPLSFLTHCLLVFAIYVFLYTFRVIDNNI